MGMLLLLERYDWPKELKTCRITEERTRKTSGTVPVSVN